MRVTRNALVGSSRYVKAGYFACDKRTRREILFFSVVGGAALWAPVPFHGSLVMAYVLISLLWLVPCWFAGREIARRR